jgi:tetratricopeptide (TPR) repeat protein
LTKDQHRVIEVEQLLDSAFIAYEGGRLGEAEALCRQVLALECRDPLCLHLLGVIAGRSRRTALGIELLREVVELNLESVEALNDLGQLLIEARRAPEAIPVLETAIALDPDSFAAHNNLGQAYLAEGRAAEAITCFERAITLAPELAAAHYNLGSALQSKSRNAEAAACYRRAIALAPDLAEPHARLGSVFYGSGDRAAALACFRRAAEAQPESTLGLVSLATVLIDERREAAAEDCLHRAIAGDPSSAEAHIRLGDVFGRLGRFDEAIACFEHALILDPRRTVAYFGLVSSKKVCEGDRPLIVRMTALLDEATFSDQDRATLHFALGKAFDDLADYEAAMVHYNAANRIEADRLKLIGRSLDREQFAANVAAMTATLTPDYFATHAALGSDRELPVLIVGMPRSGTTLVEQIISSHPKIAGGGELSFWSDKAAVLADAGGGAPSPATAREIASDYLALLRGISPSASRVTDKMPQNFMHLGVIHLVFPRARIIHCRRNPIDTCLSIYFTHFSLMKDYAFDRRGIVFFYQQYLRLMTHWHSVIPPDRLMELDYEALVADREQATRRMIAFCGLDWDDACLRSESNQRVVTTASMWQARQPIYRSSVERWRRYEPWLGEFRKLLLES